MHLHCMVLMQVTKLKLFFSDFRLLRLEDVLRSHRFYFKAAKMAIEV